MSALVIIDMQAAYFKDERLRQQKPALVASIQKRIDFYAENIKVSLFCNAIGDEDKSAMKCALKYRQKEYRQTVLQ